MISRTVAAAGRSARHQQVVASSALLGSASRVATGWVHSPAAGNVSCCPLIWATVVAVGRYARHLQEGLQCVTTVAVLKRAPPPRGSVFQAHASTYSAARATVVLAARHARKLVSGACAALSGRYLVWWFGLHLSLSGRTLQHQCLAPCWLCLCQHNNKSGYFCRSTKWLFRKLVVLAWLCVQCVRVSNCIGRRRRTCQAPGGYVVCARQAGSCIIRACIIGVIK